MSTDDNSSDASEKASDFEKGFRQGYSQHTTEVAKLIRDAFEERRRQEQQVSTQYQTRTQPYEIITDVGVKYSASGNCQPEASVKITRLLDDGSHIVDLIHADPSRGVEEMMTAIAEIQKRNVKP